MKKDRNIEALFQENQHGLDERPRSQVWDRIESQLEAKKSEKSPLKKYYLVAASIVVLLVSAVIFIFNSPQEITKNNTESIVKAASTELNEENVSDVLDTVEASQTTIATLEKKTLTNDMVESKNKLKKPTKIIPEFSSNREAEEQSIYELQMPIMYEEDKNLQEEILESPVSISPPVPPTHALKRDKKQAQSADVAAEELMVEKRRVSNAMLKNDSYISTQQIKQLAIKPNGNILYYQLTSKDDSSMVFTNYKVPYPQQIVFNTTIKDSLQVIYQGDYSSRNNSLSIEIQEYIQNNQEQILKEIQTIE